MSESDSGSQFFRRLVAHFLRNGQKLFGPHHLCRRHPMSTKFSLEEPFPDLDAADCSSALIQCLILVFAREVRTNFSQSRCGVWLAAVRISTMSPLSIMLKRHDLAIDLGPDAVVSNFSVNRNTQSPRALTLRQFLDHALRG